MDNLTAFLLDTIWIVSFALAMLYNIARRKDLKPIIWLAGILAVVYALNHGTTACLFDGKSFRQHVTFQYILWSGACALIVVAALAFRFATNTRLYWVTYAVFFVLAIDVLGNVLMHVDQNVVGLNDWGEPNLLWSKDRWWLWYWYSAQSNINNAVMLTLLFVPVGLEIGFMKQTTNIKKVFKSLLNGFNFFRFIGGVNNAYNRVDVIQDMINAMPIEQQAQAQSLLCSAKELLYRQDETGVDHLDGVNLLLDAAAHVALHHPATAQAQYATALNAKSR
ncbi:hypothetical protein [Rheinheimera aquimaris]|uniref:hypothetical protein n=1 Tax=Rheinheimera aquimaris TaxID=412437 RepID=UPI001E2B522E|nr:hypothetical protein [Rheinheimera aquimaris]MCD1597854.1 hypothetical protein [Rheinheimera aquimaris]